MMFLHFPDRLVADLVHFIGMGDAEDLKGSEFRGFDVKVSVVAGVVYAGMDTHQKGADDHLDESVYPGWFLQRTDVGYDDLPAFAYQGFHGNVVEESPVGIEAAV